jgi:hypothetical protein
MCLQLTTSFEFIHLIVMYKAIISAFVLIVALASVEAGKWDNMKAPAGKRMILLENNSTLGGRICPDPHYACPGGYFCVLNTLCLYGSECT